MLESGTFECTSNRYARIYMLSDSLPLTNKRFNQRRWSFFAYSQTQRSHFNDVTHGQEWK